MIEPIIVIVLAFLIYWQIHIQRVNQNIIKNKENLQKESEATYAEECEREMKSLSNFLKENSNINKDVIAIVNERIEFLKHEYVRFGE